MSALNDACTSWGHERHSALASLNEALQSLPEINAKRSIAHAAKLAVNTATSLEEKYAQPGDDCAAFKMADGYQLLAMEGMLPSFVANDTRAAGWSSVMANVSDIAAMGGRATAIANAYWHNNDQKSQELLFHIKRACDVFGIQFSGGHSAIHSDYNPHLAVAIIGQARTLLSCHHLQAGQRLFLLTDLTGSWHGEHAYWGCVVGKSPELIRAQWQVPAQLAELGLAVAAKDISNGGLLGTLIMMLELTGCGAQVDLNAIPKPQGSNLLRWLRAFQSYGFLLAVEQEQSEELLRFFQSGHANHSHLSCAPIGTINDSGTIQLSTTGASCEFWNINKEPLTAMGKQSCQQ